MRDYQFNYVLIGDRNKPVVLFLHGFMGSWQDFKEVADLVAKQFCCLAIDLPGHGKTEVNRDENYQMSEVAQGIIELLEQLSIERCFLVGYSMGGRLALYLTIHFPQYFFKVVLESASPGLVTKVARERRIEQDLRLITKLQSQEFSLFLEQWYGNPLFASFRQHPNYPQAIARRLNNDPNKLSKSLRYMGLGMQPSLWNNLKNNQIPLLSIVGELDSKFLAIAKKMTHLSPQTKLEIANNTGHNVHFEQLWEFASLLREFLEN